MIARRNLLAIAAGALPGVAAPARGQPAATPVIGFLGATSAGAWLDTGRMDAFRRGLAQAGVVEGRNVAFAYAWADGIYERLPALANGLVERRVAAIAAIALPAAIAAKQATATIPIVFLMGADPVQFGIVASMSRPGGNVTGVSQFFGALGPKRLELLRELAPAAATAAIGVLVNRDNPNAEAHLRDIAAAAGVLGQRLEVEHAGSVPAIDAGVAALAARGARALLLADDPLFTDRRAQIVALAARHRLPALFYARDFVAVGGLASYGSSANEVAREFGGYIARVLAGARPADLPILQPTIFELVINLRAAKALGLDIPHSLLARADEVIE